VAASTGRLLQVSSARRDLGYPANMSMTGCIRKICVYAVKVDVLEGPHKGSQWCSLRCAPMFGVNVAQLRNLSLISPVIYTAPAQRCLGRLPAR
jgi:hypothetical protein